MDASEYCALCFCHGEFPAEDNFFCPDCTRWMMTGTVAKPSDDEDDDDGSRNARHACATCGQDYVENREGDCSDCATSYQIYLRDESDDGYGEE